MFIKYLFGKPENSDLLLSFINAVLLNIGLDKIVTVEVKNPFNIKEFVLDKESIVDVKATDENGRIYNVEVQSAGNEIFINRSLYYWSKLYGSQLIKSGIYSELQPTICINIIEFLLFKELPAYHNCFLIKEKTTNQILTDHLIINYLELPKIIDKIENNSLFKYLYFMKNEGKEDKMLATLLKDEPVLGKAHNEYEKFTSNNELREIYESRQKWEMDKNSLIDDAYQKGEHNRALKDAQLMKGKGYKLSDISEITGLSVKEIEELPPNLPL
jgi:predicted transposase/invertase (TIGR01784 family)